MSSQFNHSSVSSFTPINSSSYDDSNNYYRPIPKEEEIQGKYQYDDGKGAASSGDLNSASTSTASKPLEEQTDARILCNPFEHGSHIADQFSLKGPGQKYDETDHESGKEEPLYQFGETNESNTFPSSSFDREFDDGLPNSSSKKTNNQEDKIFLGGLKHLNESENIVHYGKSQLNNSGSETLTNSHYFSTLPLQYENSNSCHSKSHYLSRDHDKFNEQTGILEFQNSVSNLASTSSEIQYRSENHESNEAHVDTNAPLFNIDRNMMNHGSFHPYTGDIDHISKNLVEMAKRSLFPQEDFLKFYREESFCNDSKMLSIPHKTLPSTHFCDYSNSSPMHDNREEKHFTDISGHTVQKLSYISDVTRNRQSQIALDSIRKDQPLFYESFPISSELNDSLRQNFPLSSNSKVTFDYNQHKHHNFNEQFTTDHLKVLYPKPIPQEESAVDFTSISKLVPSKSTFKRADGESFGEKLYGHTLADLPETENNVENKRASFETNEASVDDLCLNLSIPQYSNNHLAKVTNHGNFDRSSTTCNQTPFTSPLNTSLDLNVSGISPSHPDNSVSHPSLLESNAQQCLPLIYSNIPSFPAYNSSQYPPYSTELPDNICTQSEEPTFYGANTNIPMNLVIDSQNAQQTDDPISAIASSSLDIPSVSAKSSQPINNNIHTTLSHSVEFLTSNNGKKKKHIRNEVENERKEYNETFLSDGLNSKMKSGNQKPAHFLSNILKKENDKSTPSARTYPSLGVPGRVIEEYYTPVNEDIVSVPSTSKSKALTSRTGQRSSKFNKKKTSMKTTFCCSKCLQVFTSSKVFNRHKAVAHGTDSYECNVCKLSFKDKQSLVEHKSKLCNKKRHVCNYCLKSFSGHSTLTAHKHIHTGEKTFPCTHCDKKFRHNGTLKSHILTHTSERPFQCNVCSLRFSQRASLSRHMRTHSEDREVKCPLCRRALKDKDSLQRHMKTQHVNCSYCEQQFMNDKQLNSHMTKCHAEERGFKCDQCPSTFSVKRNLTKHKQTIHRAHDLKCEICAACFKRTDRFNRHMKIHGEPGASGLHNCDICDASFTQRNSLSKHYRATHDTSPKKRNKPDV